MKSPAKASPPRTRWEVLPRRGVFRWGVTRNSYEQRIFLFKYRAVAFAESECNADLELWNIRSELSIKGRDGRIQDKRTYGADPKHIKG